MKNRKLWNILLILLPLVAAVLNALPNAVVMHFMGDPATGDRFEVYISGYDMLAVGYALCGPMLAGISAIILTLQGIIHWRRADGSMTGWMLGVSVFGLIMELTVLIFDSMTVIGGVITGLLAAEALILLFCRKYSK